jgi:hypothetical protein
MKKVMIPMFKADTKTTITAEAARELSKQRGVRIHWRPNGIINRVDAGQDTAVVLGER